MIRMVDAEGSTTSYTYDANGQMTKTTSAMGAETSSTYDALGRQISSADALGHVTGYEYECWVAPQRSPTRMAALLPTPMMPTVRF